MATSPRIRKTHVTLEEFLRLPGIDDRPYREFIDGRIEEKVSPQKQHGLLTKKFLSQLDGFAEPRGLGAAFPELRCTFGGRSIVPDVVFLLEEHIEVDHRGWPLNETFLPPDIHIEIISPGQSVKKAEGKLAHSTSNGCPLGLLVHPDRETIDIYRPGLPPERLAPGGVIDDAPVLPGFLLPATEVFGWLVYRVQKPGADPA